ncbi:MAG: SCO family protein [Ignavibacteriales bacterium]|nr:SCO family protein [Ignavibacteriales bacterium]
MKIYRSVIAGLLLLSLGVPLSVNGQPRQKVGIEEKLGQTIPLDQELYDETGHLVSLKSLVNKPTIFTFVYFRCPGICTPLLNELTKIVDKTDLELGKDYQIITISFDHRETPDIAAGKKDNYLNLLKKQADPNGWRFLTGDSLTIQRVTDGAGFYFTHTGDDFVHAGALIVVSPEGKITRYINGIQYLPFDVKMAVYEASTGKVGPTIAKLLTFCYSYNPEGRTYSLNFMRISFVATLGLVGVFVIVFILRPRKK